MKKELNQAKRDLAEVQKQLAELERQFEEAIREKQELEDEAAIMNVVWLQLINLLVV